MQKRVAWSALFASIAVTAMVGSGCLRVGDPSPDELTARDAWAKVVSDPDRTKIMRESATHTEWMEKKKVQWQTLQFRSIYNHAQAKKNNKSSTTRSTTTTSPSTSPFGNL